MTNHSLYLTLLALALSTSCDKGGDEGQTAESGVQENLPSERLYVKKHSAPLDFTLFDARETENIIYVLDGKEAYIDYAIKEYKTSLGDDEILGFDPYMGTIWINKFHQSVYVVLFKHPSTGLLNSTILLSNTYMRDPVIIDYNIHAMYSYEDGWIRPTNLFELFFKEIAPVDIIDIDGDGHGEVELNRLYHNGTANMIENFVFRVDDLNAIDTIIYSANLIQDN